jgi:hypothetical protein
MYKSVSLNGKPRVVKLGKSLPPLSNEDREVILEMFSEHSNSLFVKEEGVWRFGSPDFLV